MKVAGKSGANSMDGEITEVQFDLVIDDGDDDILIPAEDELFGEQVEEEEKEIEIDLTGIDFDEEMEDEEAANISVGVANNFADGHDPGGSGFDFSTGKLWIYPTNYPVRDYQYNIVQQAMYKNTLVVLPTGLGKTFIAAVLMYNFFRWFPQGKVVFMAPTKPLVAQQILACYNIMGIPKEDTVEMTGTMPPGLRQKAWREKRVVFLTPQVMTNDLSRGSVTAESIKCLVLDEAHKALGNHAYCQVVRELIKFTREFRVLALSATPGSDLKAVQQMMNNLLISHIELRSEESIDIRAYTHERKIDKIVVPLGEELSGLRLKYIQVMTCVVQRLIRNKVLYNREATKLSKFLLLKARDEFRQNPPQNLQQAHYGNIEADFAMAISLYHGFELLQLHGLRSLYNYLTGIIVGEKGYGRTRSELLRNADFNGIMENLRQKFTISHGVSSESEDGKVVVGHPKMQRLEEIVVDHFKTFEKKGDATRVMIFSQYRDSVQEIATILNQHQPLIKVMPFIGQSSAGKTTKGYTQKEQLMVMRQFREGGYNTLVSTCVGEEGLDIGDVDLIVCFDAHKSPIRLVQRMGRTGRKRQGRIVMLVTEGKEEQIYNQSLYSKKSIHKAILNGAKSLHFYPDNPRMLPSSVTPQCHKMHITLAAESKKTKTPGKNKRAPSSKNKTISDVFAKQVKKIFADDCLTEEEFVDIQREFSELQSAGKQLSKPKCVILESDSQNDFMETNNSHVIDFSKWMLWQNQLQATKLIGHSTQTLNLVKTTDFIDLQRCIGDEEDHYGIEMEQLLKKKDSETGMQHSQGQSSMHSFFTNIQDKSKTFKKDKLRPGNRHKNKKTSESVVTEQVADDLVTDAILVGSDSSMDGGQETTSASVDVKPKVSRLFSELCHSNDMSDINSPNAIKKRSIRRKKAEPNKGKRLSNKSLVQKRVGPVKKKKLSEAVQDVTVNVRKTSFLKLLETSCDIPSTKDSDDFEVDNLRDRRSWLDTENEKAACQTEAPEDSVAVSNNITLSAHNNLDVRVNDDQESQYLSSHDIKSCDNEVQTQDIAQFHIPLNSGKETCRDSFEKLSCSISKPPPISGVKELFQGLKSGKEFSELDLEELMEQWNQLGRDVCKMQISHQNMLMSAETRPRLQSVTTSQTSYMPDLACTDVLHKDASAEINKSKRVTPKANVDELFIPETEKQSVNVTVSESCKSADDLVDEGASVSPVFKHLVNKTVHSNKQVPNNWSHLLEKSGTPKDKQQTDFFKADAKVSKCGESSDQKCARKTKADIISENWAQETKTVQHVVSAKEVMNTDISKEVLDTDISKEVLDTDISKEVLDTDISKEVLDTDISKEVLDTDISKEVLDTVISKEVKDTEIFFEENYDMLMTSLMDGEEMDVKSCKNTPVSPAGLHESFVTFTQAMECLQTSSEENLATPPLCRNFRKSIVYSEQLSVQANIASFGNKKSDSVQANIPSFDNRKSDSVQADIPSFDNRKSDSVQANISSFGYKKSDSVQANIPSFGNTKSETESPESSHHNLRNCDQYKKQTHQKITDKTVTCCASFTRNTSTESSVHASKISLWGSLDLNLQSDNGKEFNLKSPNKSSSSHLTETPVAGCSKLELPQFDLGFDFDDDDIIPPTPTKHLSQESMFGLKTVTMGKNSLQETRTLSLSDTDKATDSFRRLSSDLPAGSPSASAMSEGTGDFEPFMSTFDLQLSSDESQGLPREIYTQETAQNPRAETRMEQRERLSGNQPQLDNDTLHQNNLLPSSEVERAFHTLPVISQRENNRTTLLKSISPSPPKKKKIPLDNCGNVCETESINAVGGLIGSSEDWIFSDQRSPSHSSKSKAGKLRLGKRHVQETAHGSRVNAVVIDYKEKQQKPECLGTSLLADCKSLYDFDEMEDYNKDILQSTSFDQMEAIPLSPPNNPLNPFSVCKTPGVSSVVPQTQGSPEVCAKSAYCVVVKASTPVQKSAENFTRLSIFDDTKRIDVLDLTPIRVKKDKTKRDSDDGFVIRRKKRMQALDISSDQDTREDTYSVNMKDVSKARKLNLKQTEAYKLKQVNKSLLESISDGFRDDDDDMDDFKDNRRASVKPEQSPEKKKIKKTKLGSVFIEKEAEVSGDDASSDEQEDIDDFYENSFIDNNMAMTQTQSTDMRAVYLKSIKSPMLAKPRSYNRMQYNPKRQEDNIFSQTLAESEGLSEYEEDSFCVGSDEEEVIHTEQESHLEERRNRARKPKMGHRQNGKKRIQMISDTSSDEENSSRSQMTQEFSIQPCKFGRKVLLSSSEDEGSRSKKDNASSLYSPETSTSNLEKSCKNVPEDMGSAEAVSERQSLIKTTANIEDSMGYGKFNGSRQLSTQLPEISNVANFDLLGEADWCDDFDDLESDSVNREESDSVNRKDSASVNRDSVNSDSVNRDSVNREESVQVNRVESVQVNREESDSVNRKDSDGVLIKEKLETPQFNTKRKFLSLKDTIVSNDVNEIMPDSEFGGSSSRKSNRDVKREDDFSFKYSGSSSFINAGSKNICESTRDPVKKMTNVANKPTCDGTRDKCSDNDNGNERQIGHSVIANTPLLSHSSPSKTASDVFIDSRTRSLPDVGTLDSSLSNSNLMKPPLLMTREERLRRQKEKQETYRKKLQHVQQINNSVKSSLNTPTSSEVNPEVSNVNVDVHCETRDADKSNASDSSSHTEISPVFTKLLDVKRSGHQLQILVDSREISAAQEIISALRLKHGITVTARQLSSCDYILSNHLAADRIQWSSFSNSSGRSKLSSRLCEMQALYERCVLVVEADRVKAGQEKSKRLTHRTKYLDTTLSFLMQSKIKVYFTDSAEETTTLLAELCNVEDKKGRAITVPAALSSTKEEMFKFVLSMPRVTVPQALNLAHRFRSVFELMSSPPDVIQERGCMTMDSAKLLHQFLRHQFDIQMMPNSKS